MEKLAEKKFCHFKSPVRTLITISMFGMTSVKYI